MFVWLDLKYRLYVAQLITLGKETVWLEGFVPEYVTKRDISESLLGKIYLHHSADKMETLTVPQNMELKYINHPVHKKVKRVVLRHRLFSASGFEKRLIALNEEDDIKETVLHMLKQSPYPMKEEWIDEVAKGVTVLELQKRNSNDKRKFFLIELPPQNTMERLLQKAAKKEMWIKGFKRVPQLESVAFGAHHIIKKDGSKAFDLKEWMRFIKDFGKEKFEEKDPEIQKALVNFVESMGSEIAIKFAKALGDEYIHSLNITHPVHQIKMEKMDKEDFKNLIKAALKSDDQELLKAAYERGDEIIKALEGEKITPKLIKETLLQIKYINVKDDEVARVCALANVSQAEFEENQRAWLQYQEKRETSSRAIPIYSGKTEGYGWEMCEPTNPRILVVGNETNCCQHILGVGGPCIRYMVQNPSTSTVFRIFKKGKTIAQSFVWRDEANRDTLVFDNIEVLGKEIRDSIVKCYLDYLESAKKSLKALGIKRATVGAGYSDVDLGKYFQETVPAPIPNTLGYSDAHIQYLIKEF